MSEAPAGKRIAWESAIGGTPLEGLQISTGYGQYTRNDSILTNRVMLGTTAKPLDNLTLNGKGFVYKHADVSMDPITQTLDFSGMYEGKIGTAGIATNEEWRFGSGSFGRGNAGLQLSLILFNPGLSETFGYTRAMAGDEFITSSDTGSYISWDQNISQTVVPGWNVRAQSSWQRRERHIRTGGGDTSSAVLILLSNEVLSARTGFSMGQDYRLTSEKASSFIQKPVYAGSGLGNYSRDTLTNEYHPDPTGSYYITEEEVWDESSTDEVRKSSLSGFWSYKPVIAGLKGILADILWRGEGSIDEYVSPTHRALSWIPGGLTLSRSYDNVPYANLAYRQSLSWIPQPLSDLRVSADVRPAFRIKEALKERTLEGGMALVWSGAPWQIEAEARQKRITRVGLNSFISSDTLRDRNIGLMEQFTIRKAVSPFCKQTLGSAQSAEKAVYWVLQPGVRVHPVGSGFAEASYTYSSVNTGSDLDWRLAQGYTGGTTHTISVLTDLRFGDHFSASGIYRGEFNKPLKAEKYRKGVHVLSVEVKAYL
jgi:hypothetical protein